MQRLIAIALLLFLHSTTLARDMSADTAQYCPDLKHVASLATLGVGFSSITGKLRDGNFRETTLPLRGWKDCSLYGAATYTCDSSDLESADDAERAQAATARTIVVCLANTWDEVKDRSAGGYVVLHPTTGAASITLSVDRSDQDKYLVRLTLFLRRGQEDK